MQHQDSGYCYSFPAVRGIQAGRPFYIATCPLRIIPKIFSYNEDDVPQSLELNGHSIKAVYLKW